MVKCLVSVVEDVIQCFTMVWEGGNASCECDRNGDTLQQNRFFEQIGESFFYPDSGDLGWGVMQQNQEFVSPEAAGGIFDANMLFDLVW